MSFNQDMKLLMAATKEEYRKHPNIPFAIQLPDVAEYDEDGSEADQFEQHYAKMLTKMGLKLDTVVIWKGKNVAFVSPADFKTKA